MTTLRAVSFDVCLKICFRLVLIDWFATSPSTMSSTPAADPREEDELDLRTQVRAALKNLTRREPIEPTYKHLLMNGDVTPRRPTLPKDKQYRAISANLRERARRLSMLLKTMRREKLSENGSNIFNSNVLVRQLVDKGRKKRAERKKNEEPV